MPSPLNAEHARALPRRLRPASIGLSRRDFLATSAAAFVPTSTRPPNIVLIYADDLGYGDISCYGATGVRTPNIDRLAGGGLRFTNAHATSATCTPSRYSLMTGQYAWRKEGTGILPGDAPLILPQNRETLASMLHRKGYSTGAVGKWHLGLGSGNVDWNSDIRPGPLEIGFDYCFLIPATGDRVPCVFVENHRVVNLDRADPIRVNYENPFPGEPVAREHPELLRMQASHGHDQAIVNGVGRIGYMVGGKSALWVDENIADTLTRKAVSFVERNRSRPFFLYFATHDIHVPRVPNPRFAGKTDMGPRGDAIAELDWSVGEVLNTLDRLNLINDTLVLLSSDNGPVLDDGYRDSAEQKVGNHKPAGVYRGGKYSNFDGGTRVPFIARWPGRIQPDSTSGALFSQVDLYSTLGALAGTQPAANSAPDSFDLHDTLLGRDKHGRDWLIEHAGALSILRDNWKLILPSPGEKVAHTTHIELGNDPQRQLYNLEADPGEHNNVAAENPEKVNELEALLNRMRQADGTRR